jgi:asparagine synthase (glutamine-hydrolysing)
MCGIAGFFNASVDQATIDKVKSKLHHRGPDASGIFQSDRAGLIHTRLSVIELSSLGAQPYEYENLVLVFNGEIYNYAEVRQQLRPQYSFQSNSDTEVLIKAFHKWGMASVDRFIGMFAFAVYDRQTNELYLCRDRAGVKPLYYTFVNGSIFFASELKALLAFGVSQQVDTDAMSLYFRFGFVPQELSILKEVSKLQAGCYLIATLSGIKKHVYWSPSYTLSSEKREDQYIEELEELLVSAFRYRMVADVPVGVFLSGGIDSSLLAAILQKHHGGIHTFTIGFKEQRFDESRYAREVAGQVGTRHTERILEVSDARTGLHSFYDIYDEPFADTSGIPTACVTQVAKQHNMKVVLSADGGDELFGGYSHYPGTASLYQRFTRLPRAARLAMHAATRVLYPAALRAAFPFLNLEHRAYAMEELLQADSPMAFFESRVANQTRAELQHMLTTMGRMSMGFSGRGLEPLQAMMAWDFQYYLADDLLVKVDRATMFHSLECREPFLDHRLIEFANRLPLSFKFRNGKGKYLLRKLLERYVPTQDFDRRKQGFSIPIFNWFSKDLDHLFELYLSDDSIRQIPFFHHKEIGREKQKYAYYRRHNKEYNIEKMWRILSFMMWWNKYMHNAR